MLKEAFGSAKEDIMHWNRLSWNHHASTLSNMNRPESPEFQWPLSFHLTMTSTIIWRSPSNEANSCHWRWARHFLLNFRVTEGMLFYFLEKKKKGFEAGGKKGTDKNTYDFKARRYPYILKICKVQNVAHKHTQCSLSSLHNMGHTLSKRILVSRRFPLALPSFNDQFTW